MIQILRRKPKLQPVKVSDLPGSTYRAYVAAQRKREAAVRG